MAQDPRWREFERLIALVEHHLGPKGAVVRSPDHITDKVTGQPREVDASVRYQVGSVPILITIECRDRVSTEDVTWIEQLVAKRDSIGASATVAVSATGFSAPAIEKAKAHGIETRILREVSDDAIRDWAEHLEVVVVQGKFNILCTRVQLKAATGDRPAPISDILAELAKGDIEYKFIQRAVDNELTGIGDLLRESDALGSLNQNLQTPITVTVPARSSALIPINQSFSVLFDDVVVDSPPIAKSFRWDFALGEAGVMTESGSAELEAIEVEFSVVLQSLPLNVGRLLSYEDSSGRIAKVEQRKLALGDGRILRAYSSSSARTEPGDNEPA